MSKSPALPFEYPASLQEYVITERQFFEQNPQYTHVCSGAVVFNSEGKLLLVQRAKEEHAFPNAWVRLKRPRAHSRVIRFGLLT